VHNEDGVECNVEETKEKISDRKQETKEAIRKQIIKSATSTP
jgi:hypothetical protein